MSESVRSAVVLLAGGCAILFAATRVVESPAFVMPKDFAEYWSAGRLNLRGQDPYDPAKLLAEQRTIEPDRDHALMMWNPPPSLAVYMPLGLLPARLAALFWVGVQLLAIMLSCDLLWRIHAPGQSRWPARIVALGFVGTWWLINFGQNTGLLLLGIAGFLHYTCRGKPMAAGICAALTALKPHLLGCFGVLLVAEAATRRGFRTLMAGGSVILLSLCIALAANPEVIEQFIAAMRHPPAEAVPLSGWVLPVPAYWLRRLLDPDLFVIQFIPCLLAYGGMLAWRATSGREWDWVRAMPWVVAISLLTTPYGGWIFDLPVLLVPVIAAAARLRMAGQAWLFWLFIVAQAALTVFSYSQVRALHDYWWTAPAALALCLMAVRVRAPVK
jgi:hypothetical protein